MIVERLNIIEFTRLRIEQAADEPKAKKPRRVVHIEPVRPEYNTHTGILIHTYLNER